MCVTAVVDAWIATGTRYVQSGIWRVSPFFTAVPITIALYLVRNPLSAWLSAGDHQWAAAIALGLLGVRGLPEVAVAAAIVGGFLAPDNLIFFWIAVPVTVGLVAEMLLMTLIGLAQQGSNRAMEHDRGRRALLYILTVLPFVPLVRGFHRGVVLSQLVLALDWTGATRTQIALIKWTAAICRRRGTVHLELAMLQNLAVIQRTNADRPVDALATVLRAKTVLQERYPEYLRRRPLTLRSSEDRDLWVADHQIGLAVAEGQLRSHLGDLPGALAVTDDALAILARVDLPSRGPRGAPPDPFEPGIGSLADELLSGTRTGGHRRALPTYRGKPRLDGDGEVAHHLIKLKADTLSLRASLTGSLLHDYVQAVELLGQAATLCRDWGFSSREAMFRINQCALRLRLRHFAEADADLRRALVVLRDLDRGTIRSPRRLNDGLRVLLLTAAANLTRQLGRPQESIPLYEQALGLQRRLSETSLFHPLVGFGSLLRELGELGRAQELLDEAVQRAERSDADHAIRVAHLEAGKARECSTDPADLSVARSHYATSIDRLERTRATLTGELEQLQFFDSAAKLEVYGRMVAVCARLGDPAQAFDYAERGKARAMLERLTLPRGEPSLPLNARQARAVLAAANQSVLLVQYVVADDQVIVLGLRAEWATPEIVTVPVDRAELRRFVLANFGAAGNVRELVAGGLEDLWHGYDPLVAPIASWARPDDAVVLMPQGNLHYLPLHALRLDGQYLIERHPVSYAPSASVLTACRTTRSRNDAVEAGVLGDPGGDLTHARTEARAVAELLGTEPLIGRSADRRAFEELAGRADVLHYAGHARFDETNPMASGLVLADGDLVTAADVAAFAGFKPSLVTLSGCETGIGRDHPGDDFLGLLRGFLHAGASSVLASLWRVPDDATSKIMYHFYECLREDPESTRAAALRYAVLRVRRDDNRLSLYHWAPFVLVGDWG